MGKRYYDRITKYNRKNTKSYSLKLNKKTDSDIIEKFENVPSKQGYIKELVRKDLIES